MHNNVDPDISLATKIILAAIDFTRLSIIWLLLIFLLSMFELIFNGIVNQFPANFAHIILFSALNCLFFWFNWLIYIFVIYIVLNLISAKFAHILYSVFIVVMALVQLCLIFYSTKTLVPLGADLYGYSTADIKQTIGTAGGITGGEIIAIILTIGCSVTAIWLLHKIIVPGKYLVVCLPLLSVLIIAVDLQDKVGHPDFKSDYANELTINKADYFWKATYNHLFPEPDELNGYKDNTSAGPFKYTDPLHYPFLHGDTVADVLSPFFKGNTMPPNIVIILVEGLGRAFTNDGAYLGNFTPFIDSLSGKSLYWKNFLSEGGRTFAVLPSVMGSLPFASSGFLALGDSMPAHLSLFSLLKYNGYHTSFYYGGDSKFDNMATFLQKNQVDEINDEKSFPAGYIRLPAPNGFSWGYNDKELFRHFLLTRSDTATTPQLSVILTVSTHSPFVINEEDKYLAQFEQRMTALGFDDAKKSEHRNYKLQYASILYLDDALRDFFKAYSKRADYGNTIFLITGDHRMPEIPMSDKIDRYHVPLVIYSPMLTRASQIASVSTHFDISPSLLAYLHHNYKIKGPSLVSWVGQGLDTAQGFRNLHNYPLMQTKSDLIDFIMGPYHLNEDNLFKLNADLGEDLIKDDAVAKKLKSAFAQFKIKNGRIITGNRIIPDSIYNHYNSTKH